MCMTLFTNSLTLVCILSHQSLGVCEVSDPYPLHRLRYLEKQITCASCCLQICNSNINLEGMGLVLGQSWMVVYRRILFCPPIIMYCEVCCCLHIK